MKRWFLSLLCFTGLFFPVVSLSQMSAEELHQVDSLKKVANSNAHDTLVLSALIDWDNIIYFYDTDLDLELNERIRTICEAGLKNGSKSTRERKIYARYYSNAVNNLGLIYVDYGRYAEALQYFQTCLEIGEMLGDTLPQGNALNNIGMIYKHLQIPDKALEYYNRSVDYSKHDASTLCTYYNNIGLVYYELGQDSMALDCYQKSLAYADTAGEDYGIGNTLSNIGLLYKDAHQPELAVTYFSQAIESYRNYDSQDGFSLALKNMGESYFEMGKTNEALTYCSEAYQVGLESKSLLAMQESCNCLYKTNKKLGKTSEALRYHEIYTAYRDSLEKTSRNNEIIKMDFQFNMDRQHLKDSLEYANEQKVERLTYEATIAKKEKTQYILYVGIALLVLLGVVMIISYLRKKRDNEIIAGQKLEVETQKHLVEEKNKEITDSINYAKRIQEAILPGQSVFARCLPDSFILYKPKDIVAGDFYWIEDLGDLLVFAVADCTGHGVPGAMVSVVCHNALNRSVNEFKLTDPGKILDKTRELVAETFDSDTNEKAGTIRDGMDITLCVLHKGARKLLFAGANNSLYLVRKNELTETPADKQPIGKYADEKPFTTVSLQLEKEDLLYLYTDGYADQFGGPDGKKFKYKQLKEMLIRHSNESLQKQVRILDDSFEAWKGSLEQIDDVCLMGVRI